MHQDIQLVVVCSQDAEYMEQKKSDRAARGSNAWQPQARQQELDEADRFQVAPSLLPAPVIHSFYKQGGGGSHDHLIYSHPGTEPTVDLHFLVLALPPYPSVVSVTYLLLLIQTLLVLSLELKVGGAHGDEVQRSSLGHVLLPLPDASEMPIFPTVV